MDSILLGRCIGGLTQWPLARLAVNRPTDMTRPLGIEVRMPTTAAVDCTRRVYSSGFPFFARRRLKGFALIADDADLELGEGDTVVGPVSELLLLVTGRVSKT